MKHAVIIHGWQGKPESNWKPWLGRELEQQGFTVDIPAMPNPDRPQRQDWITAIARTVGQPTADTYLIGHSLGCISILRYIETLPGDKLVGGVILVAGFGRKFAGYNGQHDSFFEHDLDWQAIRKHCSHFVVIGSSDDPHIKPEELEYLQRMLDAKMILARSMGHFGSADGVFELPVARDELFALPCP